MKHEVNQQLRKALAALRTADPAFNTNLKIANALGCAKVDATAVSKFINDNYDRDPTPIQAAIEDFLKARAEQDRITTEIYPTSVTRSIESVIDTIRRTNDFAVISGPAGQGKTKGAELYHAKFPTSMLATLNVRRRNAAGVESAVFHSIENRNWKGNISRWTWLTDRLAGSNRPILVDNAQRLETDGHRWLFDFHDATGCPVVLFGNPEIRDKLAGDAQLFSRIGIFHSVALKSEELPDLARRVARQFMGDSADDIADLATFVACQDGGGHLRAVRKQAVLARQLLELGSAKNAEEAFRMAHQKLVRTYVLPQ